MNSRSVKNVYRKAKIFVGETKNIDLYFGDKKIDLNNLNKEGILVLKHIPKVSATKKAVQKKNPKININKDLISTPDLNPEKLNQ